MASLSETTTPATAAGLETQLTCLGEELDELFFHVAVAVAFCDGDMPAANELRDEANELRRQMRKLELSRLRGVLPQLERDVAGSRT